MIIYHIRRLLRIPLQHNKAVVISFDLLLSLVGEDLYLFADIKLLGLGKSEMISWLV